jgi:hypothetical protein
VKGGVSEVLQVHAQKVGNEEGDAVAKIEEVRGRIVPSVKDNSRL